MLFDESLVGESPSADIVGEGPAIPARLSWERRSDAPMRANTEGDGAMGDVEVCGGDGGRSSSAPS